MNDLYNVTHLECMNYLTEIYIVRFKTRFVQCYINQKLHFETTVISRDEETHAMLKRNLNLSIDDLKIVVNSIDLLLFNQRHDYLLTIDETRMRYLKKLQINIFRNLRSFVTSYAMRLILKQYHRLTIESTALSVCINSFTISMSLFCSHRIQKRMFNDQLLLIEDIHSH
jgi:hypothetical protein